MRNDYKKHVWMVQSKESRFSIKEKTEDGCGHLVDLEWRDCLTEPTWGKRAAWHANDMENKWTDTRIIKVT